MVATPQQNLGLVRDPVDPQFYKNTLEFRNVGIDDSEDFLADVREVRVEESVYQPCKFTVIVDNPYGPGEEGGVPGKYTNSFKVNKDWGITFKSGLAEPTPFQPPFAGQVISGKSYNVSVDFDKQAQGRVTIVGYDNLALLAEGVRHRTFMNQSHKSVVEKIVGEVGLAVGEIQDTGMVEDYICQVDETNLQFLSKIAAMARFEMFVQCDKVGNPKFYFRKPPSKPKETLTLNWGENIRSIKPRYKKLLVNFVDIPYWKYKERRIDGTQVPRNSGQKITTTRVGPNEEKAVAKGATFRAPGGWNINSAEKSKSVTQSMCDYYEGQYLCAELELEGNPDIRPGRLIKINSNDPKADLKDFSGSYYVTDTCHIYEKGKFRTKVTVSETGGYNLLQHNFSPVERLRPSQTHLVGIVTNNKDNDQPPDMGCVKVRFPTLRTEPDYRDGIESCWARVVTVGAGKNRGIDWLPEVGDEVVVAFENGDIHRPYIIGSVWNGADRSPEHNSNRVNGNGVRLRTLKTRVGHEIEFVEEDGSDGKQRGIYIKTADKLKIEMNDTKKEISLTTPHGMKVVLSDLMNSIYIQAGPGGGKIRLDPTGVHIN